MFKFRGDTLAKACDTYTTNFSITPSVFKCIKCHSEYEAIITKTISKLPNSCPCGGTLVRKKEYMSLHRRKLLAINTEITINRGDCFGICIAKLFQYYNKKEFERVYIDGIDISYPSMSVDENGLYVLDNQIFVGQIDYTSALERNFNIYAKHYQNIKFETVSKHLNNNQPIIINLSGLLINWCGASFDVSHTFIIVGYDLDKMVYICADPSYLNQYVDMPIDIIEYNDSYSTVFDFSKFNNRYLQRNLSTDLKCIFEKISTTPASTEFAKISKAIAHNRPFISRFNHGIYALSSLTNLPIYSRFACLSSFYRYLYETYNHLWLLDISNIYNTVYTKASACLQLFIKYWISNKEKDLNAYIRLINEYAKYESRVEEILLANKSIS